VHLSVDLHYPASLEDVTRMLASEAFVRWRAQRTGGPQSLVDLADVTGSLDEGFSVVVRRTLPTDQIPGHLRAFVGSALEIRQAEVWEPAAEGSRRGTVSLEITGAPVRMTGTVSLVALPDGGTRQSYEGELKATVPLFAAAVEEAAAGAVRATLASEEQAGVEWLTAP
jgi:hypothetical protein